MSLLRGLYFYAFEIRIISLVASWVGICLLLCKVSNFMQARASAPLKHRFIVVPGATAVSEGEIPSVHFRARSRQRLRPVGWPDPREERVALHP